jgi:hypothetical protein
MLGQSPHQAQTDLFKNLLAHRLHPKHPLYQLVHAIPWKKLEEDFSPLYAHVGLPRLSRDLCIKGARFLAFSFGIIFRYSIFLLLPYCGG